MVYGSQKEKTYNTGFLFMWSKKILCYLLSQKKSFLRMTESSFFICEVLDSRFLPGCWIMKRLPRPLENCGGRKLNLRVVVLIHSFTFVRIFCPLGKTRYNCTYYKIMVVIFAMEKSFDGNFLSRRDTSHNYPTLLAERRVTPSVAPSFPFGPTDFQRLSPGERKFPSKVKTCFDLSPGERIFPSELDGNFL